MKKEFFHFHHPELICYHRYYYSLFVLLIKVGYDFVVIGDRECSEIEKHHTGHDRCFEEHSETRKSTEASQAGENRPPPEL